MAGRIRDQSDNPLLLEVDYRPFYMNNQTVLGGGKCPPGWDAVSGTCYMYVGAPMTYEEARNFCLVSTFFILLVIIALFYLSNISL